MVSVRECDTLSFVEEVLVTDGTEQKYLLPQESVIIDFQFSDVAWAAITDECSTGCAGKVTLITSQFDSDRKLERDYFCGMLTF